MLAISFTSKISSNVYHNTTLCSLNISCVIDKVVNQLYAR